MDVHVPAAITAGLRQRKIDVLTSQDDGTVRFTDNELLMRATDLGRVLFTQDADFL
jgi:predicted nuclease of predicted toxin-antitoxin system